MEWRAFKREGGPGLQKCKTPCGARGLQIHRSRKGNLPMVLLMLLVSLFRRLRRLGIKIDFTF